MFITESCPHPPEYKKFPKTMKNLDRKQTPHSLDHPCCAAHPLDRSSWLCSAVLVQLLLLQLGFLGSTATLWCSVSLPKPSSSQKSCRLPSVAQQCSPGPAQDTLLLQLPQSGAEWQPSPDLSTSHFPGWDRQTLISSQNHTLTSYKNGMELNSTRNSTPLFLCTQDRCTKPKIPTCFRWVLIVNSQIIFLTINSHILILMFSEIFISLEIKRIVPLLFHENIRAVVITSTSCKKKNGEKKIF